LGWRSLRHFRHAKRLPRSPKRCAAEPPRHVATLRGRANEVQSASAEAARMRRPIVGIECLIHAAHDATTDVENVARASDVQGFAEAAHQASNAAGRHSRSLALERLADLPTELDAATAKNHPGAADSLPPVETGGLGRGSHVATGVGGSTSVPGDWTSPPTYCRGLRAGGAGCGRRRGAARGRRTGLC
jgi:hypothetical protein